MVWLYTELLTQSSQTMDDLKLSFLDVDGVLNSSRSVAALGQAPKDYDPSTWGLYFDPIAVKLYQRFVRETGAKTVLSTSWRHEVGMVENLGAFLQVDVIGQTPYIPGERRGYEVQKYFQDNDLSPLVVPYVIFDDRVDFLHEQRGHFVQVSAFDGLSCANFYHAMKILNVVTTPMAVV